MTTPTFAFPVRLSEKYRPQRVAEFVGLPKAKRVLSKFVASPYACSFLFFGPPGVGKTSVALAMAAEMGAEFHHLGSQKCNLENLEEVCRVCQYVPLSGGFHFVLIDEVESASRAAQLALLSKLDSTDAPKGTVFVFTCNSTDGLEPRFLSRCLPIDFFELRHGGRYLRVLGQGVARRGRKRKRARLRPSRQGMQEQRPRLPGTVGSGADGSMRSKGHR